jgi:hypothetical protein
MLGGTSQDALVDVFERIETFFARLETYVEVPRTVGMTNVVVKIMAQILLVLAIATRVIQQSIPSGSIPGHGDTFGLTVLQRHF